jgi:hypothetical protein
LYRVSTSYSLYIYISYAELLNGIFAEKVTLDDEGRHPPAIQQKCYKQLNKIKFRAKVISRKLKKLDPSKATGPDDIPALVLKHCSSSLGKPLASLFKLSFNIGCIPQEWKKANVVPVFNAGDKTDTNNYRPISLLCIIAKIMETIINDSLRKHLFNMKLLSSRQYGFQPGKSTIDLLTHTTQNWTDALHKGHEVKVIALDISRAFDRVWHKGLLSKLMSFGIGGRLYRDKRFFNIQTTESCAFRSDIFMVKNQCWCPTR